MSLFPTKEQGRFLASSCEAEVREENAGHVCFRQERKQLLWFYLFYVFFHVAVIAWTGEQSEPLWYLFASVGMIPAVYFSVRRARSVPPPIRLRWYIWTASLAIGTAGYLYAIVSSSGIIPDYVYMDSHALLELSGCLALLVVALPLVRDAHKPQVIIDVTLATVTCIAAEALEYRLAQLPGPVHATNHMLLALNVVIGLTAMVARSASVDTDERDLLLKVAYVEATISIAKLFLTEYWLLYLHHTDQQEIWGIQDLLPLCMCLAMMGPPRVFVPKANPYHYLVRGALFLSLLIFQTGLCTMMYFYWPKMVLPAVAVLLVCYCLRGVLLHRDALESTEHLQHNLTSVIELADRDPLTQIGNRRAFDKGLDESWRTSDREGTPLSMILIDVDRFKTINDTLGHPQGDRCLVAVATALQTARSRAADRVCRYAGDEFAVILPGTELASAVELAHRIQACMEEINRTENLGCHVTLSIGVATCKDATHMTPAMLIAAADDALYQAKDAGRDCIRSSSTSTTELTRLYEL